MSSTSLPLLYIGTDRGLWRAEPDESGHRYQAMPTGLGPEQAPGGARPLVDQRDPGTVYAATGAAGVLRSRDRGHTWEPINTGLAHVEIWSLAQHPVTDALYAGASPSALYVSEDGGDHWRELDGLRTLPEAKDWTFPPPPHISHVKHIGLVENDPMLLYCAIEEGWIVRSTDGGATWVNLREGVYSDAHSVMPMPDDPHVLVVTSGDGVYRSTDGGEHFEDASTGLDRRYMTSLVMHPDRPEVLFVAACKTPPPFWTRPGTGADTAFYCSRDQGLSWRQLDGVPPLHAGTWAAAGDIADPDCFAVGLRDGNVWMTRDSGKSFQRLVQGVPPILSLVMVEP